jgi:hypothetical protein
MILPFSNKHNQSSTGQAEGPTRQERMREQATTQNCSLCHNSGRHSTDEIINGVSLRYCWRCECSMGNFFPNFPYRHQVSFEKDKSC